MDSTGAESTSRYSAFQLGVFMALLAELLLSWGCQGPPGPAGVGLENADLTPPQVRLTAPPPGQRIIAAQDTFRADVSDSLSEIDYVLFLVNGSPYASPDSSDSALVNEPPYVYLWDFLRSQTTPGLITISVLAADIAGNSASSPVTPFYWRLPEGMDTLSYDAYAGERVTLHLPSTVEIYEDSVIIDTSGRETAYTDTLHLEFKGVSTTFTAPTNLELLGAAIQFDYPTNYDPGRFPDFTVPAPFRIIIGLLDDDGLPGDTLDSLLISPETVVYGAWTYISFDTLQIEPGGRHFEQGEQFYLALAPLQGGSEQTDQGLIILGTLWSEVVDSLADSLATGRSFVLEEGLDGQGWTDGVRFSKTELMFNRVYRKLTDWRLRAIVDYGE